MSTASPPLVTFARGVIARLQTWPALRLAVQNNWGGPNGTEKRTWIASVLVDAFEENADRVDVQYVEETLVQIMEDEFETVLEDHSAYEIAVDIVKMWKEASSGAGSESVETAVRAAESVSGKRIVAQDDGGGEDEDDDWESDNEEGEDNIPMLVDHSHTRVEQIDEDGFTTVRRKGKSHH